MDRDVLVGKLARQIPLKTIGEPDDIANGVLYLASDESRFMTGCGAEAGWRHLGHVTPPP